MRASIFGRNRDEVDVTSRHDNSKKRVAKFIYLLGYTIVINKPEIPRSRNAHNPHSPTTTNSLVNWRLAPTEEMNPQHTADPILSLLTLPRDATVFFDSWPHARKLPTPAEIRIRAFDSQCKLLNERPTSQRILHFPDLGLVIKHGERTAIAEGQMLWAINKLCPGMRAPTVYGWCTDDGEVFMYLSYVDGVTLDSRPETLNDEEIEDIARQLALMLASLRRVRQPAEETFIGNVIIPFTC